MLCSRVVSGKSWKATLNVETQEEAAEVVAAMSDGWEFSDDGLLHTTSHVLPGIATDPRTGREIFFNQVFLSTCMILSTQGVD